MRQLNSLVTGASGFIGSHLVGLLKAAGRRVRAVDIRPNEFPLTGADEFMALDLRRWDDCVTATCGVDEVYALAADMGGMGYLAENDAKITRNNLLIDTQTLEAARTNGVQHLLFTSSACVYPKYRQRDVVAPRLRESDAYPADPPDGYGWAKLMTEQLCARYDRDYGLRYKVVRLHNIYGPRCTWQGGREKAPAAICRKVAIAKLTGARTLEVWGDGKQSRSFCHIDDCTDGLIRIMHMDNVEPFNLGHPSAVSIDRLADLVCSVAGVTLTKRYVPGPQGVRGRSCDITLINSSTGWARRSR